MPAKPGTPAGRANGEQALTVILVMLILGLVGLGVWLPLSVLLHLH